MFPLTKKTLRLYSWMSKESAWMFKLSDVLAALNDSEPVFANYVKLATRVQ